VAVAAVSDPPVLRDVECLSPYELCIKEHVDYFAKIRAEFDETLALGMRARPARNVANKKSGFLIPLDNGGEAAHSTLRGLRGNLNSHCPRRNWGNMGVQLEPRLVAAAERVA
jgi:hypothetical protein